jgi:predicted ATPase
VARGHVDLGVDLAQAPNTWTHPDGRVVHLRPMEARLLAYLRARSGEVVSVRELLTNVWEYKDAVRSRTVITTMSRLRASIEPDPQWPRWIVTVPGGGFQWVGDSVPTAPRRVSLPSQRDRFIERPEADAAQALLSAGHRLVTLTGLGGIGKTRIALTVAARMADFFLGGVELVDLTSCTDADALHQRIASDLGIHGHRAHPVSESVRRGIAMRTGGLVVLDNAEHVGVELAALVRVALDGPSGATLLVTSRAPLGVQGERTLSIGPLSLEPSGDDVSPAAALFLDRTNAAGITVAAKDAERIVRDLDGVPLAIELAAARARSIPAQELQRHLAEGTLRLLRPTDRGSRHSSLDAVLEQSWSGLDPDLQASMGSLTVLEGTFSFALARAVMPSTPPAADALDRLVSQGMLQFDGARYRMLAPIAHALRRKGISDEQALERLDRYLATLPLGQMWERTLSSRAALRDAAPYLQVAWVRAWRRGHEDAARALLDRAYAVNELSGQPEVNRALADEVIQTAPPAEHASLILARANLYTSESEMVSQLSEAIDWARESLDPWTETFVHAYRGRITGYDDDDDVRALVPDATAPAALRVFLASERFYHHRATGQGSAEERLAEIQAAVALSRFALDDDWELHCLLFVAHARALEDCGRYYAAADVLDQFERWLPTDADPTLRFNESIHHTVAYCLVGMLDRAEKYVAAMTKDLRRSGSVAMMARVARSAARVKAEKGDEHAALLLSQEAVRGFGEAGWADEQSDALCDLARLELHFGRPDRARATLPEASQSVGPLRAFSCDLLLLQCDLLESFRKVAQKRVDELVARGTGRGARERATTLALHAWWLAGNGGGTIARARMREAWAVLGPAHGLQHETIARIDRIVSTLAPRVQAAGVS